MKAFAIILVWSSVRYFRILCKALSLFFAEMQRFVMWFLKVKLQSIVMPKSLTVWVLQRVFPSIEIVNFSTILALGLNNNIWNFSGFATKLLFLNHSKTSVIPDFKILFKKHVCNFRTSTMTTMSIHGSRSTRTNILHSLTKDPKVSLQLMMLVLSVFRNVNWSNVNTTLVLMLTSRWATQKHCSYSLNKTGIYSLQWILIDTLNIIHW